MAWAAISIPQVAFRVVLLSVPAKVTAPVPVIVAVPTHIGDERLLSVVVVDNGAVGVVVSAVLYELTQMARSPGLLAVPTETLNVVDAAFA